tara:strand:- start:547 stop:708 length:162 start_codon:yes stop_codon:yes gene_type:complete
MKTQTNKTLRGRRNLFFEKRYLAELGKEVARNKKLKPFHQLNFDFKDFYKECS